MPPEITERLRVGRFARWWAFVVVFPYAMFESYGFLFEADVSRLTLFSVMGGWAPLWMWGVGWAAVTAGALFTFCCGRPWVYRWLTITATALASGQIAAALWTRFVKEAPLTWVGIAWAYLPAAVFAMTTVALAWWPPYWLESDDG